MQIKEILNKGNNILKEYNVDDSYIKTRILLSSILGKEKEYLMIHDTEKVNDNAQKEFFDGIEKIKNGFPVQYIVHNQNFMGLEFYVTESVLIPQPDTEILVQECLNLIHSNNKILDLCTGSGAIGISISKLLKEKNIEVVLSDISKEALIVANINCKNNNVNCRLVESDLFENIEEKFDLIVSNPPYIETNVIDNLDNEVKSEPIIALDGGIDGLDFYRKIAICAKDYLNINGYLCLEIGYNQNDAVVEILKKNGYKDIYSKKDLGNNDRIVICKRGE